MRIIRIAARMLFIGALFALGNVIFNPEPWAFCVMFVLVAFFVLVY